MTLTVVNNGPGDTADVAVDWLLPPGLDVDAATTTFGGFNTNTGVWTDNYTTATLIPVVSTGLYVTKAASRRHLAVLDLVGFFVMVTNDGPATVQNVVVSDPLPNGLAFVSAHTRAGGYDPSSGLWAVGAIAPGERRALTIVARVDREGSITNTARLIGGLDADLLLEDNASSVTVSADPAADIEISVEGLDKISVNGTGPYVVRARNLGPSHATGVTVTAGIPLGLSFRNALASAGAYSAGTGEWMIGALRAGEAATLIVTAQVLNENVVVRAAKTKGDQFDPVIGNNQTAAVPAGAVWADVQILACSVPFRPATSAARTSPWVVSRVRRSHTSS